MERIGYNGTYVLRLEAGGAPVQDNAFILTFKGEGAILKGGTAPHKPGSTGYVEVSEEGSSETRQFYPSVFGLQWVLVPGIGSESLADFIKRNEHQALSIIKESTMAMGYSAQQWRYAMGEYFNR